MKLQTKSAMKTEKSKTSSLFSVISYTLIYSYVVVIILMYFLLKIGFSATTSGLISAQLTLLLLGFTLFSFKVREIKRLFSFRIKEKEIAYIILAVIGMFIANVVFKFIFDSLGFSSNSEAHTNSTTKEMVLNQSLFLSMIIPVLIAPIIEEFTLRAGFKRALVEKSSWKPYQYVIISSLVFGVLHYQPGTFALAPIFTLTSIGIINAILYLKTSNLLIPILAHLFYNGIVMYFAFSAFQ